MTEDRGGVRDLTGLGEVANSELANKLYDDAVQSTAQRLGKSVAEVARTFDVFLVQPLALLNNRVEKYWRTFEKVQSSVPVEDQVLPSPKVIASTMEAMTYELEQEELWECYENLLQSAISKELASDVHPSYTYIIKQLSSDDAQLLTWIYALAKLFKTDCFFRAVDDICVLHSDDSKPVEVYGWTNKIDRTKLRHRSKCFTLEDKDSFYFPILLSKEYRNDSITNLERLGIIKEEYSFGTFDEDAALESILSPLLQKIEPKEGFYELRPNTIYSLTHYGRNFCRCTIRKNICEYTGPGAYIGHTIGDKTTYSSVHELELLERTTSEHTSIAFVRRD